ncbi:phytoene/squalene synthase family protein [Nocardia sp. A7]|uniref:phytoene/squalene synthase family protein n=1 Tax=Nocardia sp. A7 TaxID=2789274 RepID=UPI00397B438F
MMRTELDAAGIRATELRAAYLRCRELNAQHGRTFFLATRLLAPAQRPAIHALYGFARWADDIVDEPPIDAAAGTRADRLDAVAQEMRDSLSGNPGADPIFAALADTAARYHIDHVLFEEFLDSMRMDLTVTDYPDRAALDRYVHGSAAVIGLQVLPVLGTVGARADAAPYAAALGKAFQLTNFLRDVAEDLDRGRVYLPADELAAFDVDRARLQWCRDNRRTDAKVRSALAAQHAVARDLYRYADAGIALLHPVSRPCVATAAVLYSEILDRIEETDFAVFTARATVGNVRRTRVAGSALARALWARRGSRVRALTPAEGPM